MASHEETEMVFHLAAMMDKDVLNERGPMFIPYISAKNESKRLKSEETQQILIQLFKKKKSLSIDCGAWEKFLSRQNEE